MEPRPGEDQPHVPPPSLWPVGFAIGIACILVGLIVNPIVIIPIGVVIVAVFAVLWIRDATAEQRRATAAEPEVAPEARAEPEPAIAAEPAEAPPLAAPSDRFPRNKFLEYSTLGFGAAIGALVTLPAIGFAVLPAFTRNENFAVNLGPIENFPEGEFVIATFMLNPSEGEVTRRTAYIRYNGLLGTVPSFTTISNRCVHLGCPTQVAGIPLDEQAKEVKAEGSIPAHLIPTAGASGFNCPCHGGAYDTEGNRTAGPPVRALDRYQFEIDNGNLIVRNTFSVAYVVGEGKDAVMKVYEPAGPGIHVDGPEAWLYPVEGGDF